MLRPERAVVRFAPATASTKGKRFMNFSRSILTGTLGLALAVACGDDDGGESDIESLCEQGCTIEASLACPNDVPSTCISECREGNAGIPRECVSEVTAALACAVNRPVSDWECGDEGTAGLVNGVCAQQSTAALQCVFADGSCPFENDDECDDPTGTAICDEGTDLADCS